ncbi:MAG: ParA family protein [Myxococcota bacterium]
MSSRADASTDHGPPEARPSRPVPAAGPFAPGGSGRPFDGFDPRSGVVGRSRVIAVSSNKGGVGKTTVSTNLAVYLRALREDLPILMVGLDDQDTIDRMFGLGDDRAHLENLKHGWAQRSLTRVIQMGQYGVHYVPSPPDTAMLKGRAEDPQILRRILAATDWPGVVILDTKSDLESLTQNAYYAADRVIVPVADRASLIEAEKVFRLLDRAQLGAGRARILLTLVDRRSRGAEAGDGLIDVLADEIARRGWPRYRTTLSRSPRVEALQSAEGQPRSILHAARGTEIHRQMRDLALEVMTELRIERPLGAAEAEATPTPPAEVRRSNEPGADLDWKAALLRGIWKGRG